MRPRIAFRFDPFATSLSKTTTSPLLNLPDAGNEPEQGRLADAVGADHADHDARGNVDRDVVERDRRAIPVRYSLDPRDGLAGHFALGVLVSAALLSGVSGAGRGGLRRSAVGSRGSRGLVCGQARQLDLKLGWPLHIGLRTDEAQASDAGLHPRVEFLKNLRVDLELDAEHQLGAFVCRLNGFWGELRVGGDKADFCRNNVVGDWIEDNAGLLANRQRARHPRQAGRSSYRRRSGREL